MFARRGTGFGRAGSWGWAWRRRKLYCVRERVSWEHKALHFFGGRGRRREAMEMGILMAGTTKVSMIFLFCFLIIIIIIIVIIFVIVFFLVNKKRIISRTLFFFFFWLVFTRI